MSVSDRIPVNDMTAIPGLPFLLARGDERRARRRAAWRVARAVGGVVLLLAAVAVVAGGWP